VEQPGPWSAQACLRLCSGIALRHKSGSKLSRTASGLEHEILFRMSKI